MSSKKFIIEVEEGQSNCKECALYVGWRGCIRFASIDCDKYDYSTMKISEYNQEKNNTMSKSLRRSVTVDFDKMFEDLSYSDKVSFLSDKICDQRLADKLKIIDNALAEVEIMYFIRQHRDTAIKVLRGEGFEIH